MLNCAKSYGADAMNAPKRFSDNYSSKYQQLDTL